MFKQVHRYFKCNVFTIKYLNIPLLTPTVDHNASTFSFSSVTQILSLIFAPVNTVKYSLRLIRRVTYHFTFKLWGFPLYAAHRVLFLGQRINRLKVRTQTQNNRREGFWASTLYLIRQRIKLT